MLPGALVFIMKKIRTEKNSLKNTILLEVGTEPLPANSIYPLAKQLKANIRSILKSNHIVFGGVETFDTYRRLVVFVKDVRELQEPREIEFRGPSKEMAFDEHNKATRAFLGFLKKNGLKEIDVEIKETSQGEYLYGKKKEPAKKTILMLPGLIKELVNSISCEKNMRWNGNYGFIRPIRWFLLLWNDTPVMFELAGVKSGGVTFGHQVLAPEPYRVKGAADYFRETKKRYIDIDFNERRRKIEKGVSALAAKRKGCLYFDPELLDELANLVECPGFISGSFNKKFLFLPDEVLMTSMKKGQKLFCVRDKKGGVMPAFLAVIDNRPAPSIKSRIRANYERVLEAKLKDSEFFLKQDIKTTLIDRVDFLKEIIFQKDLGSMYDKAVRLGELAEFISGRLGLPAHEAAKARRCALLSKADLTTAMVQEFPGLQGIIGSKYASLSGENGSVVKGIVEHYQPKSQDDSIPKSIIGCVTAMADKVDTLTACFSIGLVPTGSYDPYALRRSALGLVRIILEKKISVSFDELLNKSISLLKSASKMDAEILKEQILTFLKQRLKQIISENKVDPDLIESVLSADCDDFFNALDRITQLDKISKSKDFFECSKVMERTSNILKKAPELPRVNPKLFKEGLEEKLWNIYNQTKSGLEELIEKGNYKAATRLYADAFSQPVHVFFDKVLVNVDNLKVRNNRLALMSAINKLYGKKIADLSRMKF